MPSPPADVPVPDEAYVRRLLASVPDLGLASSPVSFVARGWDNAVWRVGSYSARIPVRIEAVELVQNEATWAATVAAPLTAAGIAASLPVRLVPAGAHPYPWLLATWVDGTMLEGSPLSDRSPVVTELATVLPSVHRPAPPDAPLNPYRGVDLADVPLPRPEALAQSQARLGSTADALRDVLDAGRAAPRWPGPRVWCHGDLHPRNLLLRPPGASSPLGVLDFGDLTAGDPAVDLSILWLGFSATDRSAALTSLAPSYDEAVFTRARGWAARFVLAVMGVYPDPFEQTLAHATGQLLD
jgi:aminoglycoside phosphotransferase (APT) family kinase protein